MIHYSLGAAAARRRAAAASAIGAATALAPVVLGLELLPRLGWIRRRGCSGSSGAAIGALVVARTASQYATARRRLGGARRDARRRRHRHRHVERHVDGRARRASLASSRSRERSAGLRVESEPDARSGVVLVASVPRGGERFGDVRASLERWRPIERRPRLGVRVRLLFGAGVVAAVFFLPFLLDDFVARSKAVAAVLVLLAWAVARWTMRGR